MANIAALKKEYKTGRRFTYADYKEWELAEGERFELLDGEAYQMAAPSSYHQLVLMELAKQLAVFFTGKPCKVFPAPFDVRLFYEEDESDDTVVQPDISVVCDKKKIGGEGCRGAPDLVVEILSPSNSVIEMEKKQYLYEEAGVKEYWIINPDRKTLRRYFFYKNPTFPRTHQASETFEVELFPGLKIELEPVFAE